MKQLRRRSLLASTATTLLLGGAAVALGRQGAHASEVGGGLPWAPYAGDPPGPLGPGLWHFFSPEEGAAVEALVDRLIPPDPTGPNSPGTPGGKDAGCATFIDRQLAGPYGSSAGLYMRPPFQDGTKEQGEQSPLTPAARYRASLAALDAHCRAAFAGRGFAALAPQDQDAIITGLEKSTLHLDGASGHAFFEHLLKDTQQGFFADPIYGGNRNMAAWHMIGFPGARYDYRDWVERHNERFPLPPLSIGGRPAWSGQE